MTQKNGQSSGLISSIKKVFQGKAFNAKSLVAFIIFGMIVLTFVLSDISGRNNGGGAGMASAAEVNGELISIKNFQEQESRVSAYYAQLFGGQINEELQRKQIRSETMGELINNVLAAQAADREKVLATDAEVKKIITQDLPYFQKDGVFQTDVYKAILSANRLTPAEFEKDLRVQTKNQKLRQLFETGLSSPAAAKKLNADLKSAQINVAYLKLNFETFKTKQSVSPAEINQSLADTAFMKKVEDFYNQRKQDYDQPEQVKASHILVRANPANKTEIEAARIKAKAIQARLAKEDFGAVAAAVSEDPGSKNKKGDLGFFTKTQMVPAFAEAAFKMQKGQVSDLVETDFGVHIIKVTDKKAAQLISLKEAQNSIAKNIISEEKYLKLTKDIETLLAASKYTDVEALMKQNQLSWVNSGFFDLENDIFPQVGSRELLNASLKLNKKSPYSTTLVREGDDLYMVKLIDFKQNAAVVDLKQSELTDKQKAFSAFGSWIETYRKNSKIMTNDLLLQ